jgi:hypothetical protein
MKRAALCSVVLAFAVLSGCARRDEGDEASRASSESNGHGGGEAALDLTDDLLVQRALRDRTPTDFAALLAIEDDQLANRHSAAALTAHAPLTPPILGCYEQIPLDAGGTCYLRRPCPPGGGIPAPAGIGELTVSSTYDTIKLADREGFYGEADARSGPFWRGDGDMISISFAGLSGILDPVSFEVRAPVGDAIAFAPVDAIDRTGALRLRWMYAQATEAAVGEMSVNLRQPATGIALTCLAPLAQRAIELPSTLLRLFASGDAFLSFQSVAVANFLPLEKGRLKLLATIRGVVDMRPFALPTAPNIAFR